MNEDTDNTIFFFGFTLDKDVFLACVATFFDILDIHALRTTSKMYYKLAHKIGRYFELDFFPCINFCEEGDYKYLERGDYSWPLPNEAKKFVSDNKKHIYPKLRDSVKGQPKENYQSADFFQNGYSIPNRRFGERSKFRTVRYKDGKVMGENPDPFWPLCMAYINCVVYFGYESQDDFRKLCKPRPDSYWLVIYFSDTKTT